MEGISTKKEQEKLDGDKARKSQGKTGIEMGENTKDNKEIFKLQKEPEERLKKQKGWCWEGRRGKTAPVPAPNWINQDKTPAESWARVR